MAQDYLKCAERQSFHYLHIDLHMTCKLYCHLLINFGISRHVALFCGGVFWFFFLFFFIVNFMVGAERSMCLLKCLLSTFLRCKIPSHWVGQISPLEKLRLLVLRSKSSSKYFGRTLNVCFCSNTD